MKARGGISVDLEWKDGKAVKAILTATIPGIFHVKMPEGVIRAKAIIDGQSNNYTGKTTVSYTHLDVYKRQPMNRFIIYLSYLIIWMFLG